MTQRETVRVDSIDVTMGVAPLVAENQLEFSVETEAVAATFRIGKDEALAIADAIRAALVRGWTS